METVRDVRQHGGVAGIGDERGDGVLAVADLHGRLGDDAADQPLELPFGQPLGGPGKGGVAAPRARQVLQRDLDEDDVRGHGHQRLLVRQGA